EGVGVLPGGLLQHLVGLRTAVGIHGQDTALIVEDGGVQGLLRRGAGGLQQGGRDRVLRKIRLRLGPALIPERRPGLVVVYHHVRQFLREDGPQVRGVGGGLLIVCDLPAAVLPDEGDGGGELAVGAALPAG